MTATSLPAWLARQDADAGTPAPRPRRTQPLLMGDILHSHAGTPVMLLHWREARGEAAPCEGEPE